MPVAHPQYPVNLVLTGRRCLVVGGGRVAARKVEGLLACGAQVHVVAPAVGEEVRALEGPGLTWEERTYRPGEVAGYRLAITATDDGQVNWAVFADGEAHGVWTNAADDPAHCSFTLPAVVRRGPIMVAVSTGGHSPALATWLRRRLSDDLGPEVSVLAGLLGEARTRVRATGRSTEDLDWQALLDGGLLALLVAEGEDAARARIEAWLEER